MASLEMPKDPPSSASKFASTSTSVSKKKEQLESGRRKLLEYRKKKAEEKQNKEKNKPSENVIGDSPGKSIIANGSGLDATDEGSTGEEIALDVGKSLTVNGFPDARLHEHTVKQARKNELEETVSTYVHGMPYARKFNYSTATISDNGYQNSLEFSGNSSNYDRKYEPSPWLRGIQKSASTSIVNNVIGSEHVQNSPNNCLFDGDQDNAKRQTGSMPFSFSVSTMLKQQKGIPSIEEKNGSGIMLWGKQDQLDSQFQFMQKSNGMKPEPDTSDNFQYLMAQPNASFPDRLPIEPTVHTQDTSSSGSTDLLSLTISLDRERNKEAEKHLNKFDKSIVPSQDDFATLEQHIDELTQEKYTLQRALDIQRSVSESLSQQNALLAEDFNSQATIINQLHDEIDKKKEELASQSLVLNSFMMERKRAQQENNSALERSQILAKEVISLEEKVLKLRSNELKIKKELESLKSETEFYRGQLTALEKDRQNLRSMLEALQEDKKLLQKMVVNDVSKTVQRETREISTSTNDLALDAPPIVKPEDSSSHVDIHNSSSPVLALPVPCELKFSSFSSPTTLSSDEHRLINNIDILITELVTEKSSFLEMLTRESSKASKLQVLNAELSRKLELQTQRLELVIAQHMANIVKTDAISYNKEQENYFVDEGDEVVERVLEWITRLFPSGSSRRRISKSL